MEIVPSSILALIIVAALAFKGPQRGLWLVLAVAPFGAAAAFNLPAAGGASILALDLTVVVLFGLVLLSPGGLQQMLGSARMGGPGFWMLLLICFSIVATLFFPRVFYGQTEVFLIARVDGAVGITSAPLRPTTGNLTQLFRMMLGALAYFALATAFRRRPDVGLVVQAMIAGTVVNFALGWLDVASHAAGLPDLLDPIQSANYSILDGSRMAGIKRMVGGFPEASSFGYFSLGLFAFWLHYWVRQGQSAWGGWMLLAATIMLLRSTSSAAYVAVVVFGVAYAGVNYASNLRRQVRRRTAAIWVFALVMAWIGAVGLFAAYELVTPVTDYLDQTLFTKMEGSSGEERMSWNAQAFENFLDTGLMGAGLGSVRASSWLLACLASLGLIGTGFFAAFLWSLSRLREAGGDAEREIVIGGLKAACLALLCSAMLTVPTPDLGLFFFIMAGLAAGLTRGGVLQAQRDGAVLR